MQRCAAIDVGTNSMRLLLCNVKDEKIVHKHKYINSTRIGSSVDKEGLLSEEGITRNMEAFHNFVKKAKEYGAEKILAIATSAVRDAKNGQDFIQRALERTGISIKTISGEEEAVYGYRGVVMGLREGELETLGEDLSSRCQNSETILVIDIGGGSTELILGKGMDLNKIISLNVGAVRMTERHITTAPIGRREQEQMEVDICEIIEGSLNEIKVELEKLDNTTVDNHPTNRPLITLIGIGGTITTLAAVYQELEPYDPDKIHNYKLTFENIAQLREKFISLTVEEIKALKGIHPKRADIIVAGTIILYLIMDSLNIDEIVVSEYDNLEGLIYSSIG